MNAITVVVPVYGDLPSLLRCVDALIATVNSDRDRVMLVNDCGPEADLIERALLDRIEHRAGFVYARNAKNLGFVGTCNRAAIELDESGNDILLLNSDTEPLPGWLDELRAVLHADDRHGIVCARSTNATIASLPFRLRDPGAARTRERSLEVSTHIAAELPRFSYPPVAMGFCFLVRRSLIERFGLFDEIFAPGYGEENDFCLRMAERGYLSVMAHRALVVHEGARSFLSGRRARLRYEHERILARRHPDYSARVRAYLWCDVDPLDAFADVIVTPAARPEVVLFIESPLDIPRGVIAALQPTCDMTVAAPPRLVRSMARATGLPVVSFGAEDGRVWDAAVIADGVSREARLRAGHAAPRILSVNEVDTAASAITAPIDQVALRRRWESDAADMRAHGVPTAPRPPAKARLRAWGERRAPRLVRVAQRLTSLVK